MGTKAAPRYANAVFTLAIERNELDAVHADMKTISNTCASSRDLQLMLKSPVVSPLKKAAVLKLVFKDNIGTTVNAFLDLLATKKRANIIPAISDCFIEQYNEKNNIIKAKVLSVVPLDTASKESIMKSIDPTATIELEEVIDKSLIGGFVLRVGDKQVDSSIKREFIELRKELLN